jgi:hypothetical protein
MDFIKEFMEKRGATRADQGNHSVFWVDVEHFNELPIEMWQYNRPADQDRVKEIHGWMNQSKRMDGIIYLAHQKNKLVCYESNHRREALKGLEGMHPILVDILWNANNDTIKDEFVRINKAVSVPELYVENNPMEFVDDIQNLVKKFCERYKKLKTNTDRPQRPNFNRDMLTNEFTRIVKEKGVDVETLGQRLETLNAELSRCDRSKLPPKVLQKCEESGLWLFAWSSRLDI